MEQIDQVLGNRREDASLADRLDTHERQGALERVVIAAAQRKKSRLRVETDAGTDLGLVLDRPLRAGDVLALDAERAIVVEFEPEEAVVIDLPDPTPQTLAAAVELGHRIGNQHWDLTVTDGAIYVPVAADRHIIENVLTGSLPAETTISYEEVDAGLWIDDREDASHAADHAHHAEHSHGLDDHSQESTGHDHSHGDAPSEGDRG